VISRLFKGRKRLDSEDPSERAAAVEALTDEEILDSQNRLAELASSDPDSYVRRTALAQITDPGCLETLLSNPTTSDQACQHIAGLLDAGRISGFEQHPTVIVARITANPTPALIESVLIGGQPETLLAATVAVPREHRDALLGHERFRHTTVLQELERRTRDRDKRLNRFARDRLEEIRQHRGEAERLSSRIGERLDVLEKPVDAPSEQDQRKRQTLLDALDEDLQSLEDAADFLAAAGEPATGAASLRSRREGLVEPIVEEPPAAEAPSPAADSDSDPFDDLARAFVALEQALKHERDFDALAHRRQALTDAWLAAADHRPPSTSQHQVFERVSHSFQQLAEAQARLADSEIPDLDLTQLPKLPPADEREDTTRTFESLARDVGRARKMLARIAWPDWAESPEPIRTLTSRLDDADDRLETWQAWVSTTEASAKELLKTLAEHTDAGELTSAKSEAARIRGLLAALPGNRTQSLGRELARISARLSELSDWQTFATTPKRESLCAAMTALAGDPLSPKDQASRIKHLRSEWNDLGPATRALDHRLLEQFNEAAEKAFEPCREYFSEQAAQRAENLAAREQICQTLGTYLQQTDWDHADFKAAEQIMRTARSEWRRFHPVDRTPGKPLESQFEKLQAQLHGHIKAEWDRNLARKRQIVEEARALIDGEDDVHDRVNRAKSLQQQWKSVGVTPRRPDQTLWREFRQACDQIFAARDEAKRSADESIQAAQQEAQSLVDEFRQALDTATAVSEVILRDFQNRYQSLPRIPERMQRSFDREFSELTKSGRVALKAEQQAAEQLRLQNLKHLDSDLSGLEQRHSDGEQVSFEATDPLFENRWQLVDNPVPIEELQRLTIEAEIAAGLDSPAPDRERRLEIQVDLMNTGRGKEILQVDGAALVKHWCTLGPKANQADELRARFFAAIDRLADR
jgi:hypothetical protein